MNGARHGFGTFSVRGPNGQTITYTGQWNQARRPFLLFVLTPPPPTCAALMPPAPRVAQGVRHGQGKITYDDAGSRWYEVSAAARASLFAPVSQLLAPLLCPI